MLHATRELFILLKSDMEAMFDNNSKCCTIFREVAHAHYYYYCYYYYYDSVLNEDTIIIS